MRSYLFSRASLLVIITLVLYGGAFLYISQFDSERFSEHGSPIHDGGDSFGYVLLTQNLVAHHTFSLSTSSPFEPEMQRAPGYSLFLFPLYLIDHSFHLAIFVQVLLVALSALLILSIGKRFLPTPWPFIAALFFVINPTTIFYSLTILSDILFTFLVLLCLYLLIAARSRTFWNFVGAGVLLGFAALVRPAGVYLVVILLPLLVVLRLKEGRKQIAIGCSLFLLAYGAVLTPWYVRNYEASGRLGLSSVGPYTVLLFDVRDFLAKREGISQEEERVKLLKELPTQNDVELRNLKYSNAMNEVALKYIRMYPISFTLFYVGGSINLYLGSGIRDVANELPKLRRGLERLYLVGDSVGIKQLFAENPLKSIWYALSSEPILTFERLYRVLLLVLILGGLGEALYRRRARVFLLLCISLVLYTGAVIGPVSYPRYRLSSEPYLLLGASFGAFSLLELMKRQKLFGTKGSST